MTLFVRLNRNGLSSAQKWASISTIKTGKYILPMQVIIYFSTRQRFLSELYFLSFKDLHILNYGGHIHKERIVR